MGFFRISTVRAPQARSTSPVGLIFRGSTYFGLDSALTVRDLFTLRTRVSSPSPAFVDNSVADTAFIEFPTLSNVNV